VIESSKVSIRVNGVTLSSEADVRMTLADFLRDRLGLTGTHLGCEHGVCGACTVIMDGRSVRSCLVLAVQAQGADIETVEGLTARDGELHPIQEAFTRHHALQCGFCTPGFLMAVKEYLDEKPAGGEAEIRQRLSGNLCRCTGYQNIVAAVNELVEKGLP